jgi:hypothetical protein
MTKESNKKGTIAISKETKSLLARLGKVSESYEDVIQRLIRAYSTGTIDVDMKDLSIEKSKRWLDLQGLSNRYESNFYESSLFRDFVLKRIDERFQKYYQPTSKIDLEWQIPLFIDMIEERIDELNSTLGGFTQIKYECNLETLKENNSKEKIQNTLESLVL